MLTIATEYPPRTHSRSLVPWSDESLGRSVALAFETALQLPSLPSMDALRNATVALGISMSKAGLRPERALIMLKQLLTNHGRPGWSPSLDFVAAANQPESRLYSTVFGWWISAFFGARG